MDKNGILPQFLVLIIFNEMIAATDRRKALKKHLL